ncbi:MAG: molybdate ABC transporter substrate-binding protein [Burkholderiaceae bacterium]|nr:molybdate ABC transporter substrate-binding protein [Burkholderiaceae bacterium]
MNLPLFQTLFQTLARRLFGILAAVLLMPAQAEPTIAAASDLKFALDEIATTFQASSGQAVKLVYGSSGNFYRQIAQGAPFELFLSADEDFVFKLADQGLTPDRGRLYAIGRIVLFIPKGSPVPADTAFEPQLVQLRRALGEGRVLKFAIANPDHAPYGRAAMEALKSLDLWTTIQPRLVLGENVSQAAQFAVSGSAQAGIFAYSLALAPQFGRAGSAVLIPETLHQPLRQRMVLTRKAGAVAQAFHTYLQQPAARAVFMRHGFALPGEQ